MIEERPKLSSKLGQNRNLMMGQRNCGQPETYNASESGKGESKVLQCWQVGTWPSLTLQKLHKWDCMDYCDSDTVGTDLLMLAELTTSNNESEGFFFHAGPDPCALIPT